MKSKVIKYSCEFLMYITAISFFIVGQYLIIVSAVGQSNVLYGG